MKNMTAQEDGHGCFDNGAFLERRVWFSPFFIGFTGAFLGAFRDWKICRECVGNAASARRMAHVHCAGLGLKGF